MKDAIDGKSLVRRYNKYADYRNDVKSTGKSFTEELVKAEEQDSRVRSKIPSKNEEMARHEERHAPIKNLPRFGKPKNITMKQAKRLARYAPVIEDAARRHNVPVELICGVILQESGGKAKAVSHCGARGLMQLMPATARRFGVRNSFDPQQNIEGGTKYLRWLLDHFDGDIELALAGYNAGEGNVKKYGNKIPPFKETRNYVPCVLGYTQSMIDVFAKRSNIPPVMGHA